MQVTCQHHATAALRRGKNPGIHWTGGSRATTVGQCGLSRLYFSVLETHNNGSRDVTLRNSCGFGSWPGDPTEPCRKATTTAGTHHPVPKRYSDSLPRKFRKKITGYVAPKTVWFICGTNWIIKTRSRHNTGSPTSRYTDNTAKYQTRTMIWRTMTKEASAQMWKRNTEELHEMQCTYTSVRYKWKAITVCRYNRTVPSFMHFRSQV